VRRRLVRPFGQCVPPSQLTLQSLGSDAFSRQLQWRFPISLCTPSSLPSHVDENRLQLWPFPTAVSPSPIHSMCEVAAILRRVTSPFPVSPRPLLTSVPSRMHFGTKPGDHVSCAFFFCSAWCFVSGRERPPPTVRLGLPSPQFCTPPSLCPLILSCLYLIWPDPHFFLPLWRPNGSVSNPLS